MKKNVIGAIRDHAIPLTGIDDLQPLLDEIKNVPYVLLGESSHGTSEYYKIRAELTKKLIVEKGFTFIVVEGDWPACQEVNRYIKGYTSDDSDAYEVLRSFNRWPTWMWANEELMDLVEWLKTYNQALPQEQKVGFYGVDVYSLWESMEEILSYLKKINSFDLEAAKKAFACFEPFNREPQMYGVSASLYAEGCRDEVIRLLRDIVLNKKKYGSTEESALVLGLGTGRLGLFIIRSMSNLEIMFLRLCLRGTMLLFLLVQPMRCSRWRLKECLFDGFC